MIRGSLEYALSDAFVNELFERTAQRQYTRELLFSDVVDTISGVVCQVFPSVNAAYQKQRERFSVSRRALVVLDPDRRLIRDVFPSEDAHAQERSLLIDVLDGQQPREVWIADRNFCTALFLFQTHANRAYFIVRQHATNVRWEAVGERRKVGRMETGMVYQQRVDLIEDWRGRLSVTTEPRESDTDRGSLSGSLEIESVFGELATALNCEIASLGYPPAALFAFAIGLVAYNILSVVRTALGAAHGEECLEEISAHYVADEIRGMMRGMTVAIPDRHWQRQLDKLTVRLMANLLIAIAGRVNLACFQKHRRGPKKPPPQRTKYKKEPHVSTACILAQQRLKCMP